MVAALRSALGRGRLPHALLFGGPNGVGKATCAGILTQAVNCRESGPLDACGRCVPCRKISRGLHPDVMWVAPAPREIKIAQTRAVADQLAYRPHEGVRRVVVIDEAHRMNAAAQNALLKTLEEPPGNALLVLVSSAPRGLLQTVRSRCQSLAFSPVPQPAVRSYLESTHAMSSSEAQLRAALAPGSIGAALAINPEAYTKLLEAVVSALRLAQAGGAGVIAAADSLAALGSGETATQKAAATLVVGRDVLRDLLVVATGAEQATLVNAEQLEAWQAWAAELDPEAVAAALGAISAGIERITGPIQPNIKLALEKTLFEVGDALEGRGSMSTALR